jgi:glucose-1-phosphate thymidylyltransferase
MKALILSGGKGTRLRPLTYTGAKQLVPVANKPILWYGIESIVKAGITDIGIIISPETGEEVQSKTGDGSIFGAKITYILQEEAAGLAHAVKIAQPFLGDSPFIMYLGDNLIEDNLKQFLDIFLTKQLDSLILLKQVTNPSAFGVAKVAENGKILELIEKPKDPPSNLALVGVYFFTNIIHQAINAIKPSARGELEITDAIQYLISQQNNVQAQQLTGWWLDTGKKDDLLDANCIILDSYLTSENQGEIDDKSKITGRVAIAKGSKIVNCTLRGPIIIGENCYLEDCFIGSYTSIANNTKLIDIDIDHSVILEGSQMINIKQRIVDSLIGQRAKITLAPKRPQALRFLIGDDSQLELM